LAQAVFILPHGAKIVNCTSYFVSSSTQLLEVII